MTEINEIYKDYKDANKSDLKEMEERLNLIEQFLANKNLEQFREWLKQARKEGGKDCLKT